VKCSKTPIQILHSFHNSFTKLSYTISEMLEQQKQKVNKEKQKKQTGGAASYCSSIKGRPSLYKVNETKEVEMKKLNQALKIMGWSGGNIHQVIEVINKKIEKPLADRLIVYFNGYYTEAQETKDIGILRACMLMDRSNITLY